MRKNYVSLEAFLRYPPTLLSAKATAGFLKRTEIAKLRFPPGFINALRKHLEQVTGTSVPTSKVLGLALEIKRAA